VEEARQSFASISRTAAPSPLPPAPVSARFSQIRTRASPLPRGTSFSTHDNDQTTTPQSTSDATNSAPTDLKIAPLLGTSCVSNDPHGVVGEHESRVRVGVESSESLDLKENIDVGFQTGQKERSKPEVNLIGKHIVSVAQLEIELAKGWQFCEIEYPRL
jgi:hypothetical protein